MKYSEKVIDHFTNPRNVGVVENADGIGKVGNPVCGDMMEMSIRIDQDIITDVKFRTFGCGAAIATSSMATELIVGKSINEALQLTNRAIAEALDGLPPVTESEVKDICQEIMDVVGRFCGGRMHYEILSEQNPWIKLSE